MPSRLLISLALFLIISILGAALSVSSAHAAPLVTVTGKTVSEAEIRRRLSRLLRDLGEPSWPHRALKRLNRPVFAYLKVFTGRNYPRTLVALQRGDRYRPMIRTMLARAGLPLALEALPMAESAYRFDARSRTGARGLWQYMPASARRYGLKVAGRVDQRTDPVKATEAAARYLKYLRNRFGNSTLLAIAAYNAGEGRIARIVHRHGSWRYHRVASFLPRETRRYVPEFLAAALILRDPGFFGFPVTATPVYRYVQIPKPLSLEKIARWSGLPVARIRRLNPELQRYQRLPVHNYILRLPAAAARRVARHLGEERIWRPLGRTVAFRGDGSAGRILTGNAAGRLLYRVQRGNHLSGIARMFGVDIQQLREVNRIRGNRIHAGQLLVIPTRRNFVQKSYRVRPGDSLEKIAKRLGIPVDHLKFINGVTDPRRLKAGQQLLYYHRYS